MIVVTGAAGFIGSCLVSRLNNSGREDIVVVDDFSKTEKDKNLEGKTIQAKVGRKDFIQWLSEFHAEVDFIYHIGARTDTAEFDKERRIFYENEPQETKLLRVKNEQYCNKLTKSLFYEKKHKYGDDYRVNMSDIFVHCMRVNGTPLYKDSPKKYEWLNDEDVRVK